MVDHISKTQMEAFCARAIKVSDMAAMAEHLATCAACRRLFQDVLKRERGNKPVSISLSPAEWFRHEHLDYDQMESLAENRLDEEGMAIVNLHLETCAACRGDVRSFLEFDKVTEHERGVRHVPEPRRPPPPPKPSAPRNQSATRWKPAYTMVALLIISLVVLAASLFSSIGSGEGQRRRAEIPQATPAASGSPSNASSPSILAPGMAPSPSPDVAQSTADSGEAFLKDGERTIRFNESSILSGLETFPAELKQSITEAILTGTLKRSAALNDLVSGLPTDLEKNSSVVGSYPKRTVVVEDRPVFRWAPLDSASSYRVQVGDLSGNGIADSGPIPPNFTQWTPSTPLKRGIVYTWALIATVNGEEIVSPAPSDTEIRFKVLERAKLGQLSVLKNQYRSHLALGIFYAQEGVLLEARREFQLLGKDNPNSPVVEKLLRRMQSLR